MGFALVSYCQYKRLLQTWWLNPTQFISYTSGGKKFSFSLTQLKLRSRLSWFLLEALVENPFFFFSSFQRLSAGTPWFVDTSFYLLFPWSHCLLTCLIFHSSYTDPVITLGAHIDYRIIPPTRNPYLIQIYKVPFIE